MAWGALENSFKNLWERQTQYRTGNSFSCRGLNLTAYSRKAKEAPCFPEKC